MTRRRRAQAGARQRQLAAAQLRAQLAIRLALLLRSRVRQQASPGIVRRPPDFRPIQVSREALQRAAANGLVDAGIADATDRALGFATDALEGAGLSALTGGGVAGFSASLEAAAQGAAAFAPAAAVLTDVAGLGIGLFDAFGGDFSIQGYATTPQLDATTALGIAASRKQAALIRQDLADSGYKFARKGGR